MLKWLFYIVKGSHALFLTTRSKLLARLVLLSLTLFACARYDVVLPEISYDKHYCCYVYRLALFQCLALSIYLNFLSILGALNVLTNAWIKQQKIWKHFSHYIHCI